LKKAEHGSIAVVKNEKSKSFPPSRGIRVAFVFDEPALAALDSIKDALGASSRAEAVRRALQFFALAIEVDQEGGDVVLRDSNGKERIFTL
jgi:hypothetical protein